METMKGIYRSLEMQLKEAAEKEKILWNDIGIKEEAINLLTAELEEIRKRHAKAEGNIASIQGAIASLELGDFTPDTEEEEKAIAEEERKVIVEQEEKNLVWTHKSAVIAKYNDEGEKLGTWRSQKKLAEELGITQSMVSYYMKQDQELQLKKRGYYLRYEY